MRGGVMRIIRSALLCLFAWMLLSSPAWASTHYQEGDQGFYVALMQMKLLDSGYKLSQIDGKYNKEMSNAVQAFQKQHRLAAGGKVEAKTYQKLTGNKFPTGSEQSALTARILDTAFQFYGVRYQFGGQTPRAFDCSGFTSYTYARHGQKLPRAADAQFKTGKPVRTKELKPGDLVFFTTYEPGPSHVGIFIGYGRFIHASASKGVVVSRLDEPYWKPRYLGAKRII